MWRRALPSLLVALALCQSAAAQDGKSIEAQRSRLEILKEQIADLSRALVERTSKVERAARELELQERKLAETARKVAALDRQEAEILSDIEQLEGRAGQLREQRQHQRVLIAREMESAYRLGTSEPVKLLLNQEDPQTLARIVKYYRYFADARKERIEAFTATLAELDRVRDRLAEKRRTLVVTRENLAAEMAVMDRDREERGVILARLNDSLDSDRARLEKLRDEQEALEALITSLEESIANLGTGDALPFTDLKGKLPWPLEGRVAHAFGATRVQSLKWTGWFIEAAEGDPVQAVHTGRVAFADYLRGQGMMVIIDHGDGYLSLYAHNQVLLKETGDWVQAGDRIALAGTSGGLANSALYFEIRHNGKPQDPKLWLGKR